MIQGGASGSPVFLPDTGAVVGTMFASLGDPTPVIGQNDEGQSKVLGVVHLPTSHSHAVPSHYLSGLLKEFQDKHDFRVPDDARTIDEILATADLVSRPHDGPPYQPLTEDDDGKLQFMLQQLENDN